MVFGLVGNVTVVNADTNWTGAGTDNLWSTAANWDAGVPDEADVVTIASPPEQGPVIDGTVAAICAAVDGPGHESQDNNSMEIIGGSFTTVGDWSIAKKGSAIVNISGGTIEVGDDLNIGPKAGEMTFNITGGVVNVSDSLIVARKGGAIATFNMYGGTLSCGDFQIAPQDTDTIGVTNLYGGTINIGAIEIATEGGTGLLDIQGGTLLINANAIDVVTEYINLGKIVGYGGANAVSVTYDEGAGVTTVVATEAALASNPSPANGQEDVLRDVVLSWTPGGSANQHDVYFGTSFDDVNAATNLDPMGPDKVYRARQDVNNYVVSESLDFGQTYYWRVDEVSVSASRLDRGDVWQFTTEPFAYPIENITATASSSAVAKRPENTVNGSGLDDSGLLHGKDDDDNMWLSSSEPDGAWIEYEFDKAYKLDQMWVWNYNGAGLNVAYGLNNVTIEYSTDGTNYTALGTTHEFLIAPGENDYAHNTAVDFGGVVAKYVKITANSNWSNGITDQYGLSEVRFLHMPMRARKPSPESGATDVGLDAVLSFRAGREAAEHDVYFSSDEQAVIDGTVLVTTGSQTSHGPLSLDLGTTYYWKVNEINIAETPSMWQGDTWNFTTQEFFVVDDFESYNDLDPADPESKRIFNVWIDGYQVSTNGSLVGYENAPFCERVIVHGGMQSMPFFYNNTAGAAYSEAELPLSPPQDWTQASAATLVLYFHGAEGNTGQLYVKVDGSKVVYDGDVADIQQTSWKQWNVDLASFGVDLQNVTTLSIGIDGNGAGGTLYVDDIRLYRLAP
jgi:hypothetical protein